MRTVQSLLTACMVVLVAGGCALSDFEHARVVPGQSLPQAVAIAGNPTVQRPMRGGGLASYYVYGPGGWQTWRVLSDADARVTGVRQVLTAANFRDVLKPGVTTRDDVLFELGPPGLETDYPNIGTSVWIYRWMEVTTSMRVDLDFDRTTGILRAYNSYWDPCPRSSLTCMGT